MSTDAPHRYQAQRDRIDALAELATSQAKFSDRMASRDFDNRSRHLADFDRMFRCVRTAAAWVVRLDQAGEGKPPIKSAREARFERRVREAVERTEAPQPYLPSLPNLPDLDAPVLREEAVAADVAEPEPQAGSAPRPQWEIHREALAKGPAPPPEDRADRPLPPTPHVRHGRSCAVLSRPPIPPLPQSLRRTGPPPRASLDLPAPSVG